MTFEIILTIIALCFVVILLQPWILYVVLIGVARGSAEIYDRAKKILKVIRRK